MIYFVEYKNTKKITAIGDCESSLEAFNKAEKKDDIIDVRRFIDFDLYFDDALDEYLQDCELEEFAGFGIYDLEDFLAQYAEHLNLEIEFSGVERIEDFYINTVVLDQFNQYLSSEELRLSGLSTSEGLKAVIKNWYEKSKPVRMDALRKYNFRKK